MRGFLKEKQLELLCQVEGRAQAKGQDIWKVRGCWAGLEGGVWALCDRECVRLVAVTPAHSRVHSRYSVHGELRKEQDQGGIWDAWASSTQPVVP